MTNDKMRRKRSAILSVAFWSKTMEDQLSLFDKKEFSPSNIQSVLMPKDFLLDWKEKIFNNQQFIKNSFTSRQTNLFTDREQFDPNKIDPFDLVYMPEDVFKAMYREQLEKQFHKSDLNVGTKLEDVADLQTCCDQMKFTVVDVDALKGVK